MTQNGGSWCWKLGLVSFLAVGEVFAFLENCALAQIVPDTALGAESSRVTFTSPGTFQIDGGATRGKNLFHSFSQFSVPINGIAYFNNALGIQNIISRVTGRSISKIDGLLQANGTANLFLINPNGIIFGSNASLNIRGSFLATTASSLNFADGTQFSATAPQPQPLLTMSVPIGLQFGANAGSILNQSQVADSSGNSIGLQVQQGQTLALVGGNVALAEGILTTAGGRIELGSVAGSSLVSLNPNEKGWALGYENVQDFQDIQLSQHAVVNASGYDSSNIHLQGRRVILTDGSQILAANLGSNPGGTLTVNASELVELTGTSSDNANSGLFTIAVANGTAGNTIISTRKLLIRGGAGISTESAGLGDSGQIIQATGQGGNLAVNASESVELLDGFLSAQTNGSGDAGNISIKTGRLVVQGDGARVSANSAGISNAGNLEITAHSIRLDNGGSLSAENILGEGGNITLQQVSDLRLRHNSNVSTDAGGAGNGGNINIDTGTLLALESSGITANAVRGQGGNIQITAQGLFLSPDSNITASSQLGINGRVQINTLVNNPSQGLVTLPVKPVDVTGQIAQGCPAGVGPRASKFVVTGRGGLPPDPTEALRSEPALADLGTTVQRQGSRNSTATSTNPTSSEPAPLVEAQGWVTNSKGEVVLVAQAPTVTLHIPWLTPTTCQVIKTTS